jgi:hypothetical protein
MVLITVLTNGYSFLFYGVTHPKIISAGENEKTAALLRRVKKGGDIFARKGGVNSALGTFGCSSLLHCPAIPRGEDIRSG